MLYPSVGLSRIIFHIYFGQMKTLLYLCGKVTMIPTQKMRLPYKYKKNYQDGKVTYEMICDCIYSLHQRLKRYNDRYELYSNWLRHSEFVTASLKKRVNDPYKIVCEYTNVAMDLLMYLRPCEIHKHRRWDADEQKEHEDYYFIYKEGDYVFRKHIPAGCAKQFGLNIIEMTQDLYTERREKLTDLLSLQFVKIIYIGLRDGTLKIVHDIEVKSDK